MARQPTPVPIQGNHPANDAHGYVASMASTAHGQGGRHGYTPLPAKPLAGLAGMDGKPLIVPAVKPKVGR